MWICCISLSLLTQIIFCSAHKVTFEPSEQLTCSKDHPLTSLTKDHYKSGSLLAVRGQRSITQFYTIAASSFDVLAGNPSSSGYSNGRQVEFRHITDITQADGGKNMIIADRGNFCLRNLERDRNNVTDLLGNCSSTQAINMEQWVDRYIGTGVSRRNNLTIGQFVSLPGQPQAVVFDEKNQELYLVMTTRSAKSVAVKVSWPLTAAKHVTALLNFPQPLKFYNALLSLNGLLLTYHHGVQQLKGSVEHHLTGSTSTARSYDGFFNESAFDSPSQLVNLSQSLVAVVDKTVVRILDFSESRVSSMCRGSQCGICKPVSVAVVHSVLYISATGPGCDQSNHCLFSSKFKIDDASLLTTSVSTKVLGVPPWILAVSITAGVLILILIVVLSILFFTKRRGRFNFDLSMPTSLLPTGLITNRQSCRLSDDASELITDHSLPKDCLHLLEKLGTGETGLQYLLKHHVIGQNCVTLEEKLGTGHFGNIHRAILTTASSDEVVAVKLMKSHSPSMEEIESFLREALTMAQFNHPNVLNLMGLSYNPGEPAMIVMPCMSKGDLSNLVKNTSPKLGVNDLLEFSHQIAEGMEYLASQKFVHRDLAARNCLVDAFFRVKIADFGLSRDIYGENYYVDLQVRRKALPWKWMAPECLLDGKFSTKTDVWAFGVLVWELFTYGGCPYPVVADAKTLQEMLAKNYRLSSPTDCPADIYALMKWCWAEKSLERPEFRELVQSLGDLLDDQRVHESYDYAQQNDLPDNLSDNLPDDPPTEPSKANEPAYCDVGDNLIATTDTDMYLNFAQSDGTMQVEQAI